MTCEGTCEGTWEGTCEGTAFLSRDGEALMRGGVEATSKEVALSCCFKTDTGVDTGGCWSSEPSRRFFGVVSEYLMSECCSGAFGGLFRSFLKDLIILFSSWSLRNCMLCSLMTPRATFSFARVLLSFSARRGLATPTFGGFFRMALSWKI